MKSLSPRILPFATAILCSLITPAVHAVDATTDPVGFITETVNGGSQVSPKLSLISPTLMQPVAWQGIISTITGTTITVPASTWTANQFNGANGKFFVEIVSGANAGAWTDILTTSPNSLTTFDDLSSFVAANGIIRIRKHRTVADVFGATNSAGLLGGTSVAASDEVFVYDGSNSTVYWYYNASDNPSPPPAGTPGAPGWYDTLFNQAGGALIAPHQGVVVKRKAAGNINMVVMGTVKTGNTFFPVRPGLNVLGTVSAQGLTLANCGLYTGNSSTGIKASTGPATGDEVTIYTATGQTNYWYYDASDNPNPPAPGTLGGIGWYDVSFNIAGNQPIVPGSSIVLNRKPPGVIFNWVLPSPTTF